MRANLGRSVLAVLAAVVVWGFAQAIGGAVSMAMFPEAATATVYPTGFLVLSLVLSIAYSLLSGATTAWVARNRVRMHGVWAGIALLAVGIAVQMQYWTMMPLWYHILFLALLVPAAVGGALWVGERRVAAQ